VVKEAWEGRVSVEDYRINAFVRSVLVRRWIDTSRVDFGTSNGVVYLKGMFRQIYRRKPSEEEEEWTICSLGPQARKGHPLHQRRQGRRVQTEQF
jgi:hypothetical protein